MLDSYGCSQNGNGDALIHISLFGTGVSTSNNEFLWTNRSGTLELIAREGDPAPQTPPGVVLGIGGLGASPATFNEAAFNDTRSNP